MRKPELLVPASSLEVPRRRSHHRRMPFTLEAKHLDCVQKPRIFRWKI